MDEVTADQLWSQLGELFGSPDNMLSEIAITGLSSDTVPAIVGLWRGGATAIVGAKTWTVRDGEAVEVAVDAADLSTVVAAVVAEQCDPFHVVLQGVSYGGVAVPDLGMFIFDDEVALDYQPGPAWTPLALAAFVEMLCESRRLAPDSTIEPDRHVLPAWRDAFTRAVAQYCGHRPAA